MRDVARYLLGLFLMLSPVWAESDGPAAGEDAVSSDSGASSSIDVLNLPEREGSRPQTSEAPPGTMVAHQQLAEKAPVELQELLFERAAALEHVITGRSFISVPGARAFHLDPAVENARQEAFLVAREFAHLHPPYDGSFHMVLPPEVNREVLSKGWGERHPRNPRATMVYGSRTAEEAEVVWRILLASYRYAMGLPVRRAEKE